jgi:glycerophosphoryl diester phosphodiesterase
MIRRIEDGLTSTGKKMGYENIVITLYRMTVHHRDVITFAERRDLFGVIRRSELARDSQLATKLLDMGVPVYVHTLNDSSEQVELNGVGVTGIYTDDIAS